MARYMTVHILQSSVMCPDSPAHELESAVKHLGQVQSQVKGRGRG
jgi:hypothetical protein